MSATLGRGDAVRMASCTVHTDDGKVSCRFTFKAPKGQKFVFLFLGAEEDGKPMNANDALKAMGWTPPE